jgi:hypothetical protein
MVELGYVADRFGGMLTKYDIITLKRLIIVPANGKIKNLPKDGKSILDICYKTDPIHTLGYLLRKANNDLREIGRRYQSEIFEKGMKSDDTNEIREMLSRLKVLERDYGPFVRDLPTSLIPSDRPLSRTERLEIRLSGLEVKSCIKRIA